MDMDQDMQAQYLIAIIISPTLTTMQGGGREPHIIECRKIGNVYGEQFTGGNYGGNVWDKDHIAPTLKSSGSAGQEFCVEVKKMETNILGNLQPDKPHQSTNVYDENGVAPNIIAGTHGYGMGNICEQQIVAMRGRNPENPSDRTAGIHLEQKLEPNSEGICNTLTSVQKDNLVMETTILGGLEENSSQRRKVYDKEGVSPTLQAAMGMGGGCVPFVAETKDIKVLGNYMPSEHDASRVVSVGGVSPTVKENHGTVTGIVEMKEIIPSDAIIDDTYKNRPEGVYTEYAPTLRSEREGLKVIKIRQATKDGFVECELPGIADLNYTSSTTRRGRVQEGGEDNSNDNNGEYP